MELNQEDIPLNCCMAAKKLIQGLLGPYLRDAMIAEEENAMLQWRENVTLKDFRGMRQDQGCREISKLK